jgi:uncharacterized cupredoxin-like copper-binding protein
MTDTMKFYRDAFKRATEFVAKRSKSNYIDHVRWVEASYPGYMLMQVETTNTEGEKDEIYELTLKPNESGKLVVTSSSVTR